MEQQKTKVFVFNHGHMDIEWYKTIDGYRMWVADIIDTLYDRCLNNDDYKTYVFDGAVFLLDDLVREFPAYESKIKELVAKGKLTIGPFYTQFDEWTPSAESMVKNCLYGDRVSRSYPTMQAVWQKPTRSPHAISQVCALLTWLTLIWYSVTATILRATRRHSPSLMLGLAALWKE